MLLIAAYSRPFYWARTPSDRNFLSKSSQAQPLWEPTVRSQSEVIWVACKQWVLIAAQGTCLISCLAGWHAGGRRIGSAAPFLDFGLRPRRDTAVVPPRRHDGVVECNGHGDVNIVVCETDNKALKRASSIAAGGSGSATGQDFLIDVAKQDDEVPSRWSEPGKAARRRRVGDFDDDLTRKLCALPTGADQPIRSLRR